MKKQQYANAVRSVEIKCKKTANAVPSVGNITSSIDAAKFARQFYGDDLEIYESFFLILMNTHNKPIWPLASTSPTKTVQNKSAIITLYQTKKTTNQKNPTNQKN